MVTPYFPNQFHSEYNHLFDSQIHNVYLEIYLNKIEEDLQKENKYGVNYFSLYKGK